MKTPAPVSWGCSIDQVKATEDSEPDHETDDYLALEVRLGRFRCVAAYIFVGNQLVRGKYRLLDEYQNRNNYITAFDELKKSVSKKYGSPAEDKTYWLNDLYKDDFSEWGIAVAGGHLSKFAAWETQESTITVAVLGENFDVSVGVEYSGKSFDGLEEAIKESELMDNL